MVAEQELKQETQKSQLNTPVVRRSFINRYKKIAKSNWFKRAYKNKSIGDYINYA